MNFCPFMSINPALKESEVISKNTVYCNDKCALYIKGYCSINVLAQKAIKDFENGKDKKLINE